MCVHGMRNMKTEDSNFQYADIKLIPFRSTWARKNFMGPHDPINFLVFVVLDVCTDLQDVIIRQPPIGEKDDYDSENSWKDKEGVQ